MIRSASGLMSQPNQWPANFSISEMIVHSSLSTIQAALRLNKTANTISPHSRPNVVRGEIEAVHGKMSVLGRLCLLAVEQNCHATADGSPSNLILGG